MRQTTSSFRRYARATCFFVTEQVIRAMKRVVVALLTSGLVGCATARPILYENQKYREVGRSSADRDIAECSELADQAGATPHAGKAGQAAKSAGVGAVGARLRAR
jgi:hypothetical protein